MEKRQILCSAVLLLSMGAADASLSSVIEHRSQSSNNARKVAGEFGYVHLRDQDEWYMRSASAFEYQRTFRSNRLAQSLFGCYADNCDNLLIQGSAVASRDDNALLADNFYLPTDYNSVVSVKPVITDLIFDYDLYVGFNCKCIENAYFRLYTPLVRSKWALNMNECIVDAGVNPYSVGDYLPCAMDRDLLNGTFCDYLNGGAPQIQCATIINPTCNLLAVGNELATTVFNPLSYYNACCKGSHTATTLADLRVELGWNFWNTEKYRLGINTQAAFPTGTRPNAQYMFNPVVGNGKHWEFGGGVIGDYVFWQCGDMEKSFSINLDANLTYMFDNHEQRTFDLIDNELSRFLLAARVGQVFAPSVGAMAAGTANTPGNISVPCGQFKYEFTPVANLTTIDIKVKNALQADVAIWFNYTNRRFSADLGYNLWARSHDEIEVRENCHDCPNICDKDNQNTWVIKGCSQMYGFVDGASVGDGCAVAVGGCNPNFAVPLSPSASTATITSCGTLDNPALAWGNLSGDETARVPLQILPSNAAGVGQVSTSLSPIYIACEDLDLCARPRGISNKVWANLQWTWDLDRDCNPLRCKPFLGLGGEVEFGVTNGDCSGSDCSDACSSSSSCVNPCSSSSSASCGPCSDSDRISVAASQWGVWLKGGLNFE